MTLEIRRTITNPLHEELHDLCQPLTALQCRLEMSRMHLHDGDFRETVDGCLEETRRMFEVIARMRQQLRNAEEIGK